MILAGSQHGETTKSKRADAVVIHPQLADELRAIRPETVEAGTSVVRRVPGIKAWKADLKAAGIKYGDTRIGYADLHAQRKTLSTMLAAAGVSPRVRQAHLRHTDPRLTEGTYTDEAMLPIAAELAKLAPIPRSQEADPDTIPFLATGTDDRRAPAGPAGSPAGIVQEICGPEGQNQASPGKDEHDRQTVTWGCHDGEDKSQAFEVARVGTQRQSPASCDTGPREKRVMGLEPTTFTLAT